MALLGKFNVRHSYNLASIQVAHGVTTAYYEMKNQTCDQFAALFISGFVLNIRYQKEKLAVYKQYLVL